MTTDLLDLVRRLVGAGPGPVGGEELTTTGDDHPVPDVRTDPQGAAPAGADGGDLLAVARSLRASDVTGTDCAISAIRGISPPASPLSAHLALIAQPDDAVTARLSEDERLERWEASGRRRCYTCGQMADGRWDDGSPRWDHGHDPRTGQRWTMRVRRGRVGLLRTCPACGAEHAVGTTCEPTAGSVTHASHHPCTGVDLVDAALVVFGDDIERVVTAIAPSTDTIGTWCAISERSAKSPSGSPRSRGHRLRDKREKREKGGLDAEPVPLFGDDVDGSRPPRPPA